MVSRILDTNIIPRLDLRDGMLQCDSIVNYDGEVDAHDVSQSIAIQSKFGKILHR